MAGGDEQSLLTALEASRAHPGPTLLDIKVLPKTMTHDYASWWRTGDAQVAESLPFVTRLSKPRRC
jgi:3D-(3,5/4)-trihydroxycyclohexane-1,2-dione acylhydrolase (decyclizing)